MISKNNGSAQEGKYDTGKTINFSDCEKKKEELLTLNNKKKDIESEIDKLQSVVVLLEKNKNILKDISNDKDSVETEDKQCSIKNRIEKGPVENLNYLSHIVNVTQTYIDSDPMRAKLELKTIETNINSIAEELMQIVKIPEDNN